MAHDGRSGCTARFDHDGRSGCTARVASATGDIGVAAAHTRQRGLELESAARLGARLRFRPCEGHVSKQALPRAGVALPRPGILPKPSHFPGQGCLAVEVRQECKENLHDSAARDCGALRAQLVGLSRPASSLSMMESWLLPASTSEGLQKTTACCKMLRQPLVHDGAGGSKVLTTTQVFTSPTLNQWAHQCEDASGQCRCKSCCQAALLTGSQL
ncbi:unnamed protein product [Symbiodinium necroappetens]|uniref:Uncharacterized protein n=1 Tax=Symbiodinium necroappetens TaxID=1628268 RepID=A0A812WMM2_9DINO|nr:unnamed protein product [Symbiodinium necroappetens]